MPFPELTDELDDVSPGFDAAVAERLSVGVQEVHVPHVSFADAHQDQGERDQIVRALDQQPFSRFHVCREVGGGFDSDTHNEREKKKKHTKS